MCTSTVQLTPLSQEKLPRSSVKRHPWYLVAEQVPRALFDNDHDDEEKQIMALNLVNEIPPDIYPLGKPDLAAAANQLTYPLAPLSSFISYWLIFDHVAPYLSLTEPRQQKYALAPITETGFLWLFEHPATWGDWDVYLRMKKWVSGLVNQTYM